MAKKKIVKPFDIYCDVYGTNLLVLPWVSWEKFEKYLKTKCDITISDYYKQHKDNTSATVLEFDKYPYHVLWISDRYATDGKRGSKSEEIGRIVHEITHHVLRVCVAKGIPTFPEMDNLVMDEPLAYLVEFYTRNVLKKLWKELR